MKLTDEQIEALSFCRFCQRPIEVHAALEHFESDQTPVTLQCGECMSSREHLGVVVWELALAKASELVTARMLEAGAFEHFKKVAVNNAMRERSEQN